jgi:hypothetical protein
MKTTRLKMFSELKVAENLVCYEQSLGNRAKLFMGCYFDRRTNSSLLSSANNSLRGSHLQPSPMQ